jgi:hypothetical protein
MAYFAGLVLISYYSAEARQLGIESSLEGPRRRLLATRTVSGRVFWADNAQAIAGAVIKAYDNDVIGSDYMGQATAAADGKFLVSAPLRYKSFLLCNSKNQIN